MARAMWKGNLKIGKHELAFKLYSAVEDRTIRFRLLHAKDQAPVEQRIIRKDSGDEVGKEDTRKALALNAQSAVILQPDELAKLVPPESRDVEVTRFVKSAVLGDQWFDRPYYLGPDGDGSEYFALAEALARKEVIGICRWVMRKKRYVGALGAVQGFLTLTTLRRADQVLSFSGVQPAKGVAPAASELKLAQQLVSTIEADFDPSLWRNEYRLRLCELIEAKARGAKIERVRPKKNKAPASLAESLRASIAAMKEKKVA